MPKRYNPKRRKKHYLKNKKRLIAWQSSYNKEHYLQRRISAKKWRKTITGKYLTYKGSAKERGLVFDLSQKEFAEYSNKPCYYCGELSFGLDRVDNTIGYLKNNIVNCCEVCNRMKRNYTQEDFLNKCKQILINLNIWAK